MTKEEQKKWVYLSIEQIDQMVELIEKNDIGINLEICKIGPNVYMVENIDLNEIIKD